MRFGAIILQFVRDAFVANIGLKALSLAMAIGLFTYLHGQQDVQQRTVPVGVISLPPESGERELMTNLPPSIHVTLRGTTRAIDQLIQSGVAPVEIDLRKGQKESIAFDESMFSLPRDVEVVIIDPPRIDLEWQNVITREIPIQASITGQPTDGYVIKGEPIVEPQRITVRGPVSLVEVMQFARLAAFDVSGLSEGTWTRRIAIDAPPNRVSYVGPQSAKVTVHIVRRKSRADFGERPVEVVGVSKATTVPKKVRVRVIGPPEVVEALHEAQVVPRADLTEVKGLDLKDTPHGSAKVKVSVDLAHAEAEVQPPTVTVKW